MPEMSLARRLRNSLKASAGTVVFGMEEGTSGAAAAAVSMMAGPYLEAQTSRDERAASQEPRGAARRRRHEGADPARLRLRRYWICARMPSSSSRLL